MLDVENIEYLAVVDDSSFPDNSTGLQRQRDAESSTAVNCQFTTCALV